MAEKDELSSKVQVKTILKGAAAQSVRPAAMAGFKVADFQMNNGAAYESVEDVLKNEIAALHSAIASLNGEIANIKKKHEQEIKTATDKGVQDGTALGMVEGEKKALAKFNANLKILQDNMAQTFENLYTQQKENFGKVESAVAEIALAIAKRVFCEEITQNPNIIARVIKEALTFLGQEEMLKIRLNPQDMDSAVEKETFWKPVISSLKNVELVIDETIERGGCLLEAQNGSSIDMRLETIWEHIEETIRWLYSSQAPAQSV
jgi:flagellar assembly protein FliH